MKTETHKKFMGQSGSLESRDLCLCPNYAYYLLVVFDI